MTGKQEETDVINRVEAGNCNYKRTREENVCTYNMHLKSNRGRERWVDN
jgi:hypothetical protein